MKTADPNPFKADSLHEQVQALSARVEQLAAENAQLIAEKASLFEQLRLALAQRFGRSSEKRDSGEHPDLFFNEAEQLADAEDAEDAEPAQSEEADAAKAPAKRRRGGRASLPPELPRVEIVHDLPEDQKLCPHDGQPLKQIGREVSEQLDIVPAKIRVLQHVRLKYACPCCEEGVHLAKLPPQPLPKSNASPGLLAYIAIAKYQDGLPLYRQEAAFGRLNIELSRNTQARWMIKSGELVAPLIERLRVHQRQGPLIHMDETTVQVNTEPGRAASSPSYMWVSRGGQPGQPVVLFDYDQSRAGSVPYRLLAGFTGTLLTDGYEGYARCVREYGLTHAGCWVHARRYFIDAQKAQPKGKTGRADQAISLIRKLYAVERRAKGLSSEEVLEMRQTHSQPLVDQIERWAKESVRQVPPKGLIGKALNYLLGQWDKLILFLDDGRIPLDNNVAENAIRPFAVGRRAWLFSHTPSGAHASAALYGLIETAKANGLEPYAYLLNVFTRLPAASTDEELDALLPWHRTIAT